MEVMIGLLFLLVFCIYLNIINYQTKILNNEEMKFYTLFELSQDFFLIQSRNNLEIMRRKD